MAGVPLGRRVASPPLVARLPLPKRPGSGAGAASTTTAAAVAAAAVAAAFPVPLGTGRARPLGSCTQHTWDKGQGGVTHCASWQEFRFGLAATFQPYEYQRKPLTSPWLPLPYPPANFSAADGAGFPAGLAAGLAAGFCAGFGAGFGAGLAAVLAAGFGAGTTGPAGAFALIILALTAAVWRGERQGQGVSNA